MDGPVLSGIPADYSGLPAGLAGIPVVSSNFPTLKKMDLRCEIKGNFGITYAHFNVNDLTKAIIYNHAYKYNSNKRAYKYRVIHIYT